MHTHTNTQVRARTHARTQVLSILAEVRKMDERFQTFKKNKDQKDEIENNRDPVIVHADRPPVLQDTHSKSGTSATALSRAATLTPPK